MTTIHELKPVQPGRPVPDPFYRALAGLTQGAMALQTIAGKLPMLLEEIRTAAEKREAELRAEVERLRAELIKALTDILYAAGCTITEGNFAGWVDSCAMSSAMLAGDRLVEFGLWERHPDGCGRRWFYRPLEIAEAAKGKP